MPLETGLEQARGVAKQQMIGTRLEGKPARARGGELRREFQNEAKFDRTARCERRDWRLKGRTENRHWFQWVLHDTKSSASGGGATRRFLARSTRNGGPVQEPKAQREDSRFISSVRPTAFAIHLPTASACNWLPRGHGKKRVDGHRSNRPAETRFCRRLRPRSKTPGEYNPF